MVSIVSWVNKPTSAEGEHLASSSLFMMMMKEMPPRKCPLAPSEFTTPKKHVRNPQISGFTSMCSQYRMAKKINKKNSFWEAPLGFNTFTCSTHGRR